ncbi:MAG: hypothetical protein WC967_08015 [Balneolaceae bacterium]
MSILFAILFAYASLVATHEGEFWPFSIYPMFSQAGNPWTRSFVRDVSDELRPIESSIQTEQELYGKPFVLNSIGVHQNDLSNFLSKNNEWTPTRKQAVRNYFKNELDTKRLVIYKVRGELESGKVAMIYEPFMYLNADTTIVLN